jgi:hypothetical protein
MYDVSDWDAELDDLVHHWGSAYVILHPGTDRWVAQRRDNGVTLRAAGPGELLALIRADYQANPVGRG